jgi:hypothetical protein
MRDNLSTFLRESTSSTDALLGPPLSCQEHGKTAEYLVVSKGYSCVRIDENTGLVRGDTTVPTRYVVRKEEDDWCCQNPLR